MVNATKMEMDCNGDERKRTSMLAMGILNIREGLHFKINRLVFNSVMDVKSV
jgi:hypothetical protein